MLQLLLLGHPYLSLIIPCFMLIFRFLLSLPFRRRTVMITTAPTKEPAAGRHSNSTGGSASTSPQTAIAETRTDPRRFGLVMEPVDFHRPPFVKGDSSSGCPYACECGSWIRACATGWRRSRPGSRTNFSDGPTPDPVAARSRPCSIPGSPVRPSRAAAPLVIHN
jgi:hypothetical protein